LRVQRRALLQLPNFHESVTLKSKKDGLGV